MLEALLRILGDLAPWLLLGAAIAGLIHVCLPRDYVRRHLRGRGGVLKAVLLGVPLPLCSCGVIPAGLGLKRDGASSGATVGFLISTPQTGVDSILVSASFLGWPFALFKVLSATVTGLVGGWLTSAVTGDGGEESIAPAPTTAVSWRGSVAAFAEHTGMILESIWRWIVFGVVASALIETYLPLDFFSSLATGGPLLPVLAVLVISIPLYVCATASVPIAAALVATGLPAGAALVFLMAGPATNVATIGSIYRVLGRRVLAVYLGTIVVGSVVLGLVFDFVLPVETTVQAHDHGESSWWRSGGIVVLLALFAWYAGRDSIRWVRKVRRSADAALDPPSIALAVGGLTCGSCVARLESALRSTPGVHSAEVTLEPGRAVVRGTVDESTVRAAVKQAGYEPGAATGSPG